jgi:hypothetical protein
MPIMVTVDVLPADRGAAADRGLAAAIATPAMPAWSLPISDALFG